MITGENRTLSGQYSAPTKFEAADLRRLGLTAEAEAHVGAEGLTPYSDLMISSHAPYYWADLRINYAATDQEFRQRSIDELVAHLEMVSRFPNLKQVNLHFGLKKWTIPAQTGGQLGDYDLMIDAIRQIAERAAQLGLEVVLENGTTNWRGIDSDVAPESIDWNDRDRYFGNNPEEWVQTCLDVDRPNVALCLDTSHACTFAQREPDHQRRPHILDSFLNRPDLIKHVHWSDNYLYDPRGRNDSHLSVGRGTLPTEFHRAIKSLNATILLEHFHGVDELEQELDYIAHL